jgi:hypothetical protein
MTQSYNLTIGEFLDQLDENYSDDLPYAFRAKNIQAYEMGMELKKMNDAKYVRKSLIEMDEQFDLGKFEASLKGIKVSFQLF